MELDKDLQARQEARCLAKKADEAQRTLAKMSQQQLDSIVEAVAKKVVGLGATCIIADSPASKFTAVHLKSIYEASGMNLAAANSKAELNDNFDSVAVDIPEAERLKHVEIIDVVDKADAVINICKMKTHELTGYSGCVKNLYGIIPGLIKAQTHALFAKLKDFCNALFY